MRRRRFIDDANEVPTVTQCLIESSDGTAWSVAPSPDKGARDNVLDRPVMYRTTSCVAAGGFAKHTLIFTGS